MVFLIVIVIVFITAIDTNILFGCADTIYKSIADLRNSAEHNGNFNAEILADCKVTRAVFNSGACFLTRSYNRIAAAFRFCYAASCKRRHRYRCAY